MMTPQILFIAPYADMFQQAVEIVSEFNLPVTVVEGELYEGVERSKGHTNASVDVIISRGGTANLIAQSVNVPVIEVEVSPFDLLRILTKHSKSKIAVIGSENVISGVKSLAEILQLEIDYFSFVFDHEIKNKIEIARKNGAETIIGDAVAERLANDMGIESELIRSGREAILNALNEAIKIRNAIVQEREKNLEMNAIVEYLNEGIVLTDSENNIKLFNPIAETMFHMPRKNAIGKNFNSIMSHFEAKLPKMEVIGHLLNIRNKYYSTNFTQLILDGTHKGNVYRFEDTSNIQKLEEKIRKTLSKNMLVAKTKFRHIIGESDAIKDSIRIAQKYATVDITVLIQGESGTGKEMIAQSIHNASQRKNGPFIAINCATLPSQLLESKLFGYDEGAFTGASKGGKRGVFELAHNGTLFLDEIGEMDLMTQARMLRVLQEKEVMRVGGEKNIPVNVRIIAASNKNLNEEVAKNRFRVDLFYRLNVLKIEIPNLHQRDNDVIILSEFFLAHYGKVFNKKPPKLNDILQNSFRNYNWPGNIRQLENVIQKIVLLADDNNISSKFTADILHELHNDNNVDLSSDMLKGTLEEINRNIVRRVFEQEGNNKSKTAERLNITRTTLSRKLS